MNFVFLILLFSSFSWSLTTYDPYDGLPDHAPLNTEHDHENERFLDKSFKTNGEYDAAKVGNFLVRLRQEKLQLFKEMAEAIKLETLEIQFEDYSDAQKQYDEAISEDSNDYAKAYTKFMEPILEKAKLKIEANAPVVEIDSLIDSFMSIYYGFYRPGIVRNWVRTDIKPLIKFKEIFKGYTFSKSEPIDTIESNNLEVGTKYKNTVEECLKKEFSNRHLLSQEEIVGLKLCQFDISLLEPGKSSYWTKDQVDFYDRTEDLFPIESDRFVFSGIKYSGVGSLKLEAKVERIVNGKKVKLKFKLKLGNEVPQELITSNLSHLVGFHQDILRYYPKVKFYLPKGMSYNNLQRIIKRKYSGEMRHLDTFVESRSAEDEEEQWVVVRNVLVEVKHPDKVPLDSYEIWGGDLPNRREFRGVLGFFSLVNLQDIRPDNVRFSIVKRKDGNYAPELSVQDTGQSLGLGLAPHANFTTGASIINFLKHQGLSGKTVNSFMNSHMFWTDENVTFNWFEFSNLNDRFSTTTYSDVKWMARKIAKVTWEQLSAIVRNTAIQEDEQTLYLYKLANRRNEMVEAFNLTSEYPLFDIPDLDTYSPNANIQNGKIAVAGLPGVSKYQQPKATIWPIVLQAISGVMSLISLEDKLKSEVRDTTITGYAGGLNDFGVGVARDTGLQEITKKFSISQVIPGIKLFLNREVGYKGNFISRNNGNSSHYYVKDSLRVEITAGTKGLYLLTQDLPINISAEVKAWGREYTHTQVANSLKDAYSAPVKLFRVISDIQEYAANKLDPEEIVSVSDSYGFQSKITADVVSIPFIEVGANIATQWQHSKPIHFYRDTMGQLHTYLSTVSSVTFGVGLDFLNLNYYIAEYPIIGMDWSISKNKTSSNLYTFLLPTLDMNNGNSLLTVQRRKNELNALKSLLQGNIESPHVKVRRDADIEVNETASSLRTHFLGLFHKKGKTKYSQTRINYLKEEEKLFHRYFYSSESLVGLDITSPVLTYLLYEAGTIKKDGYTIDVQMEEGKPLEGIAYLNIFNYRPHFDRSGLKNFIDQQSKLYAQSDSELFYRGMELPAAHEVNDYKKLYAHHRIYISTGGVIEHLQKLSNKQIKELLKTFYRPTEGDDHYRRGLFMNLLRMKLIKRKMAKNLSNPHELVKQVAKVIKSLNPDRSGTLLLRKLFGEKNIYVMGDIIGVNSSINHMENHNIHHDRRFAGTSWGTFPGHPPIRKYLMKKEVAPLDYLVNIAINTTDLYGNDPEMDNDKF